MTQWFLFVEWAKEGGYYHPHYTKEKWLNEATNGLFYVVDSLQNDRFLHSGEEIEKVKEEGENSILPTHSFFLFIFPFLL